MSGSRDVDDPEAPTSTIFPLSNPGIVSIPLAFLLGWLGTVLDKRTEDPSKQSEMEVRSLTGVGAEKAVAALERGNGWPRAGLVARRAAARLRFGADGSLVRPPRNDTDGPRRVEAGAVRHARMLGASTPRAHECVGLMTVRDFNAAHRHRTGASSARARARGAGQRVARAIRRCSTSRASEHTADAPTATASIPVGGGEASCRKSTAIGIDSTTTSPA